MLTIRIVFALSRYGLALGFVAVREKNDRLLLTAVSQINHGGPQAVIDDEQALVVANLNLDAGKKAMNMSDLFSAHSFFKHGISYLPTGHWNEHYDVSLELFNLAAKCAMMNAEYDSLRVLTGQVMRHAKSFKDKCQVTLITITLLGWSGDGPEAVELINSTLSRLEEQLPAKITPVVIKRYLGNTKAQLAGLSDDALLIYPAMTNPSKMLAVEVLAKLFNILTFTGERSAMPIIPFKMIQISLTYGMSPLSPVGFAQYGNYLALAKDEFEEGYRYVKLALSLMKKMPSRAHDGTTIYYANLTKLHVEPMQSSIEGYLDAYEASMKSGNPLALQSSFVYNTLFFWLGKELNAVVVSLKDTMKESKYHKNLLILSIMPPMFRMVLRLMGQSDTPQEDDLTSAFGETWNEGDITGKHLTHLHAMFFVRLSEALLFREHDKARDATEKYFSVDKSVDRHSVFINMFLKRLMLFLELTSSMALTFAFPRLHTHSYSGLVSFWVGREKGDKNSKKWIERGVKCKEEIEKLAVSASVWNFQNSECPIIHCVIFLPNSIHIVLCTLIFTTFSLQRRIFSKPKNNSADGTLRRQKRCMMPQY
jgi:hypothetical protein